jgi:hypothetical protein
MLNISLFNMQSQMGAFQIVAPLPMGTGTQGITATILTSATI